jgi:chromosome segregation ATPase
MKSLLVLCILLSTANAYSQDKPVRSRALAKCEASLTESDNKVQEIRQSLAVMTGRRDELLAANKELQAKNEDLTKSNADIKAAARTLLENDAIVYPATNQLRADHNDLIQKYNSLLGIAQNQQAQLSALNSRQQRFNNALAVYSAMPKYQPPQQVNVQISNCTALPALCAH